MSLPQVVGWMMFLNPDGYGGPLRVYISNDGGSFYSTFMVMCYAEWQPGRMLNPANRKN